MTRELQRFRYEDSGNVTWNVYARFLAGVSLEKVQSHCQGLESVIGDSAGNATPTLFFADPKSGSRGMFLSSVQKSEGFDIFLDAYTIDPPLLFLNKLIDVIDVAGLVVLDIPKNELEKQRIEALATLEFFHKPIMEYAQKNNLSFEKSFAVGHYVLFLMDAYPERYTEEEAFAVSRKHFEEKVW